MDLTVAICTYNGEERVPEVLRHLRAQRVPDEVAWEVIVVDNNSSDDTAAAVREYAEAWGGDVRLRYVLEKRQGLAYARQRAVDEAAGEWVAFLDDDNLPREDWVQEAIHFARGNPRLGSFGGRLLGEYEIEPPISFGLVQGLFAINDREDSYCYSAEAAGEFPPGAGLVVRRSAWLAHVPRELASVGVRGDSRANVGEDIEVQWYLHAAGWEVWHNAAMVCKHRIPASRFSPSYLRRFFEGIGRSRHATRMMRFAPWQRPIMAVVFWLNDLRQLVQHLIRYRHKHEDPFVRGRTRVLTTMLMRPLRTM